MPNTSILIGSAILPTGRREVGPFAIQAGEGQFTLVLDSTQHLNSGVTVVLEVWDSVDSGTTWRFRVGGARSGGAHTGEDGLPITDFTMQAVIPEPENANRQVKVVIDVRQGSLVTAGGRLEFVSA